MSIKLQTPFEITTKNTIVIIQKESTHSKVDAPKKTLFALTPQFKLSNNIINHTIYKMAYSKYRDWNNRNIILSINSKQ